MRSLPSPGVAVALASVLLSGVVAASAARASDVVYYHSVEAHPAAYVAPYWYDNGEGWPIVGRRWAHNGRGGGAPCLNRYGSEDYFCAEFEPVYDRWGGYLGMIGVRR